MLYTRDVSILRHLDSSDHTPVVRTFSIKCYIFYSEHKSDDFACVIHKSVADRKNDDYIALLRKSELRFVITFIRVRDQIQNKLILQIIIHLRASPDRKLLLGMGMKIRRWVSIQSRRIHGIQQIERNWLRKIVHACGLMV